MKRRRFKDRMMQAAYDHFVTTRPDPESQKARGSAGNAYYVGRRFADPSRPFGQRGSVAYAAWAAGLDVARDL